MGTWGAGLYDDDDAADLKNAIALVCKVPKPGEELLRILVEMHDRPNPDDEAGAAFWLVAADQFERKKIACPEATTAALRIVASGAELERARQRGADDGFIAARRRVLDELAARLRTPRPARARPVAKKPPDFVLDVGEVFAFPTMRGYACHPYRVASHGPFVADGWGALVVLARGRAFEWLPWCALASLTVDAARKPTLDAVCGASLLFHSQTDGAGRFVPKRAHATLMGLERLGAFRLDAGRAARELSTWSIARAVQYDWTIAYAGFASTVPNLPTGSPLVSLLAK